LQIKSIDSKFFIPVVFHNLKNYDAHHIFRYFSRRLAVKYDRTGFVVSYQFLNASLEKLVKNLTNDSFRHIRKHLRCNDLLFAKGIFPYDWFDSFKKLDCAELPP
jgi:hypothetical protein